MFGLQHFKDFFNFRKEVNNVAGSIINTQDGKPVSDSNPFPVKFAGGGDGTSDVNVKNWPTEQKVSGSVDVGNFPKWQGVGDILQGTVDASNTGDYPKRIDLSGENATAIEVVNTGTTDKVITVSNLQNAITGGIPIAPGDSRWFYFPVVFISVDGDTGSQGIAFQAVRYG